MRIVAVLHGMYRISEINRFLKLFTCSCCCCLMMMHLLIAQCRRAQCLHPSREKVLGLGGEVVLVFFEFNHEDVLVSWLI